MLCGTFKSSKWPDRDGSSVVIFAVAPVPRKCREVNRIASPVSGGAYLTPVKEIVKCEEGKKCITRRYALNKARLVWHLHPKGACIDIGEDISGKQRDGDPDNEPEAIIGPTIGQQGNQPHEVLWAEYFASHDEDQQDRYKRLGNIQLAAPLQEEVVEIASHKQ